MSLCSCVACASTPDSGNIQWFLCAAVDIAPDAGMPGTTAGSAIEFGAMFTPNTANTTAIGTTGNFTNQDINGLLSGYAWTSLTVTYGFPTSGGGYGFYFGDSAPTNGFQVLSAAQQTVARAAFSLVSEYTALTFVEQTGANAINAQIRLAGSATPTTSYAYYPGPFSRDGDIWFGNIRNDVPTKGSYAYSTFLHEIGHALGLKHGQIDDGTHGVLPTAHNSTEWSVMTYMSYIGANGNAYENAAGSGNQTYMIDDIAALQYIYGANFNIRAGNTAYTWSPLTGEMSIDGIAQGAATTNTAYAAIWDGNGTDTYDLSNYTTALSIDLRPGEWSLLSTAQLANLGAGNLAHGNISNAHLYLNSDTRSLIENATGGTNNDTLRGNTAANTLSGGFGDDTLRGDLDNDLLAGGAGSDTVIFSGIATDYAISFLGGTTYQFIGPDGTDTLTDIELVIFGNASPMGIAEAAAACFVTGTAIATPDGPRPVEALRIGDLVTTAAGTAAPIRWIGRRHYDAATMAGNVQLRPVRILPGALADGVPARDLHLSPQHAVWLDDAEAPLLIPAAALVNTRSITQPPCGATTYLHIELDRHALILAEGATVESFADTDSRALFDNAAEFDLLYPRATPAAAPMPRSEEGFAVAAAWQRLAQRCGLPAAAPATLAGPLHGQIERIAGGFVEGWAMDPSAPGQPVELTLQTPLGRRPVLANRYRGDLQRAGIGTARHGFRIPVGPRATSIVLRRTVDGAELSWATG